MKEQKDNPVDYCTLFPDRILQYDISQCCKAHDDAYLVTTTITRQQADVELMNCVKDTFPTNSFLSLTIPLLMYLGVRLGGRLFFKR